MKFNSLFYSQIRQLSHEKGQWKKCLNIFNQRIRWFSLNVIIHTCYWSLLQTTNKTRFFTFFTQYIVFACAYTTLSVVVVVVIVLARAILHYLYTIIFFNKINPFFSFLLLNFLFLSILFLVYGFYPHFIIIFATSGS